MLEEWAQIDNAPGYLISTFGVVCNTRNGEVVAQSLTQQGDLKVNMFYNNRRHTRSVRSLMANAFLIPYNRHCNTVIVLDGDQNNMRLDNLTLRPRWFAWQYSAQLKREWPHWYHDLPLQDQETGSCFANIIEAGITEGLLFSDIWRSYQDHVKIFPLNGPFVRC